MAHLRLLITFPCLTLFPSVITLKQQEKQEQISRNNRHALAFTAKRSSAQINELWASLILTGKVWGLNSGLFPLTARFL